MDLMDLPQMTVLPPELPPYLLRGGACFWDSSKTETGRTKNKYLENTERRMCIDRLMKFVQTKEVVSFHFNFKGKRKASSSKLMETIGESKVNHRSQLMVCTCWDSPNTSIQQFPPVSPQPEKQSER